MYYVEKESRNLVRFNLTLNNVGTNDVATLHNAEKYDKRRRVPLFYSLMRDKQELICAPTFNFPTLGNQEISVV